MSPVIMSRFRLTGTVFRHEIRSAIRDRNTLIYTLVIPLFLYPALIWGILQWTQFQSGSLERQQSRLAWEGDENLPGLAELVRGDERLLLLTPDDPLAEMETGKLDAFIRFTNGGASPPRIETYYDLSRDRSTTARSRIDEILKDYRENEISRRLTEYGETPETIEVVFITEVNVASSEEMGRFLLSLVLPLIMVIMLSIGAMHPAVDALVGEKERKTVESILTAGAPRQSILAGKFLAVVTAAMTALLLNLIGMVIALTHMLRMIEGQEERALIHVPLMAIPVILVTGTLLAALISSAMITLAAFARTFKEGQSYVAPFYFLSIIPAVFGATGGIELTNLTALIPITNVVLLFRQTLTGPLPLVPSIIVILVTLLSASVTLYVAQKVYGDEDVLLGTGGRSLRSLPAIVFSRGEN